MEIAYTKRPGGTNLSEFTLSYAYDDAGYIKSVTNSGKSDDARTYTYDAQGQMLTEKIGSKTYTYTYDAFGNIKTASDGTTTHSYTYGNSDWRDLLTAYDSHSIVYDNAGNPTSYYNGNSWTFGWQNGRHLVSAKKGSTQTSYTYDADGIRDSKTVGSVKYNFITMNGRVVRQTWNGNTLDIIYDVNGSPYACKYNGTYYIYVLNLQGDVIRIVDSTGATKAEYQYDAWGKVLNATGSMANINPIRYRGYYYDTESSCY